MKSDRRLDRQELLKKLEEEWQRVLEKKHEFPPEVFADLEKGKKELEFSLKYGHHGGGFFETTEEELKEFRKYMVGSATLGDLIKKVVDSVIEMSEQPR